MNRKPLLLVLVGILLAVIGAYTLFNNAETICLKNKCFETEIAISADQQMRGLSGRSSLENNKAMLFVFPQESAYSFWMKDMKFSIDILWISENGTVIYIARNAQPCGETCQQIVPPAPAKYVLEVNAGQASEIQIGDKADISP